MLLVHSHPSGYVFSPVRENVNAGSANVTRLKPGSVIPAPRPETAQNHRGSGPTAHFCFGSPIHNHVDVTKGLLAQRSMTKINCRFCIETSEPRFISFQTLTPSTNMATANNSDGGLS